MSKELHAKKEETKTEDGNTKEEVEIEKEREGMREGGDAGVC